jgi:isopenicillin-N N-acyltransferase-like protein
MTNHRYRHIRISGNPVERSLQYGTLARNEIHNTKQRYEDAFSAVGVTWTEATRIAQGFLNDVSQWRPDLMEEIEAIARGAQLSTEDMFTINCRTEVLWAAARQSAENPERPQPGECSSFALESDPEASRGVVVGQNWDWLEVLSDSVIVLEVDRPDGPNYVTVVEAGLLAKTTLNQAGVGIGINTLMSSLDGQPGGIPFHFVIRALADVTTVNEGIETVRSITRASSGNYVLGSAGGDIVTIETAPGDATNVFPVPADGGAVVHTNHFLHDIVGGFDLAAHDMADSYPRLDRMRDMISHHPGPITVPHLMDALADHTNSPLSVCTHPDGSSHPDERWATLAGIVMETDTRSLHLAAGTPCQAEWETIDYSGFLAAPTPAS